MMEGHRRVATAFSCPVSDRTTSIFGQLGLLDLNTCGNGTLSPWLGHAVLWALGAVLLLGDKKLLLF